MLPNLRFRHPIGLLLTSTPWPAKLYCYFATFGLLLTSWPRNVLKSGAFVKIVNFLSIQGDFEPFQCQWADLSSILPFRIRRATSVPLGKATKFALHHGKMSTTKHRAIQILHISMFQFTFKYGYNDFISKYTDINSLHVTQIDLLHNDTFCST